MVLHTFWKFKQTPCDPIRAAPKLMKDLAKNGERKAKILKGELYHIFEIFIDSPKKIQFVSCRSEGFTKR